MCNIWLLNVLNSKDNSDSYVAHKSIVKRKRRPRTNKLNMSLTIEEFFDSYLNKDNILQISIYKLIYYYLIESKLLLDVDLFAINLRCTPHHIWCPILKHLHHEYDSKSLTGRCVRLHTSR